MTVLNVLPVLTKLTASTVLTVFIVLAEYFEKHDSLLTTDNLKAGDASASKNYSSKVVSMINFHEICDILWR